MRHPCRRCATALDVGAEVRRKNVREVPVVKVNRHATPQQGWQPLKRAHGREAPFVHSYPSLLRTPKVPIQKYQRLMSHVCDCNAASQLYRRNLDDTAPLELVTRIREHHHQEF